MTAPMAPGLISATAEAPAHVVGVEQGQIQEPIHGPISQPCLHVTLIPTYRDQDGGLYLSGDLWKIDLEAHFAYLPNFQLASPCISVTQPPAEAVRIDHLANFAQVKFIDLPAPENLWSALLALPVTSAILWQAIGEVEIVHTGLVGWPIPVGWVAAGIALLKRKFLITIIESAPWRGVAGMPSQLRTRLRSIITEFVNGWFVNRADLPIFTQNEYRQSLMHQPERGFLNQASWIDQAVVLSSEAATAKWQARQAVAGRAIRVLFAARLVPSKGIQVLLTTMQQLGQAGVPIELGILGQGDLLSECEAIAQTLAAPTKITILGTLPYGSEFFELVRTYDLLVVPNLQDEQPRIIYDVYSQAVPVLGSDNGGLRECVRVGETGILVPANQPEALAEQLQMLCQNPELLAKMGLAALEVARQMTHTHMHWSRWQALAKILQQR